MAFYITKSEAQTQLLAERLARGLEAATTVALFGEMGAGKTAFVRGLAKGLNISAKVSSPTFAVVHDYGGEPRLVHFDMYRVADIEELYSSGFYDYLDSGAVLAVEWSENIENVLPEKTLRVKIKKGESENDRIIEIDGNFDEKVLSDPEARCCKGKADSFVDGAGDFDEKDLNDEPAACSKGKADSVVDLTGDFKGEGSATEGR